MTRMLRMVIVGSVLCGALVLTGGAQLSSTQGPQTPEALLGAAIHQEEAEGNLEAAIESYQTFLAQYGDNRPLAVQALLRMGQAYERLGRPDARDAYERILRDYAEQADPVGIARARLAALDQPQSPADASTMVVRRVWSGRDVSGVGGVYPREVATSPTGPPAVVAWPYTTWRPDRTVLWRTRLLGRGRVGALPETLTDYRLMVSRWRTCGRTGVRSTTCVSSASTGPNLGFSIGMRKLAALFRIGDEATYYPVRFSPGLRTGNMFW